MDSAITPQALTLMETLLLDEVFAPMRKELGALGDLALQPFDAQVAQLMARTR
ncbi:MAG TPA: hypothetical protein VMV73_03845 [Candidatus Dormibacteraeota bacterium]|nr:hypothetical protein [Candidatus Dormibacteraeota bacterium]